MGGGQSKGYVGYYHYVVHDTAEQLRTDPESMEKAVSDGRTVSIRAWTEICSRQQKERSGVWKNPRVDTEELDTDCDVIRKAFINSRILQERHLEHEMQTSQ